MSVRNYTVVAEYDLSVGGDRTPTEWARTCLPPGSAVEIQDRKTGETVFQTDDLDPHP